MSPKGLPHMEVPSSREASTENKPKQAHNPPFKQIFLGSKGDVGLGSYYGEQLASSPRKSY